MVHYMILVHVHSFFVRTKNFVSHLHNYAKCNLMSLHSGKKSRWNPKNVRLTFLSGQCKWLLNIYVEKMINNNRIKQSFECLEWPTQINWYFHRANGTQETQLTTEMVCMRWITQILHISISMHIWSNMDKYECLLWIGKGFEYSMAPKE